MSSVYVVVALALTCLILVVLDRIRQQQKPIQRDIGMLDLKEFKDLPYELRATIKKVLPDPDYVRKSWGTLTSEQKQMFMQQFTKMIPHPHQHPPPSPPPPPPPPPLKKGFLLKQNKKKDTKDEKKDEVVTLSVIRTDETDGPALDNSNAAFLGSDD